jgi:hypothetical protein
VSILAVLPTEIYQMEKQVSWAPGYSVTDDGRVFSSRVNSGRISSQKRKELKTDQSGKMLHKRVTLSVNGDTKRISVHRLVAEAFLGSPSKDQTLIRHLNGNPEDNRASNISWGTPKENEADKKRHDRHLAGERNHFAKLKLKDVEEIRGRLMAGQGVCFLAGEYGVNRNTISNIKSGKNWKI